MSDGSAEFTESDVKEYPDLGLINVNPALNNEQMAKAVFDATL